MNRLLPIISTLVAFYFIRQWYSTCGSDISVGHTLPFCNDCTAWVTMFRLLVLAGAVAAVIKMLRREPVSTVVYRPFTQPVRVVRIHWGRIILLGLILTFPLWRWWVDLNTDLPEVADIWLIRRACIDTGFKGTLIWIAELGTVVLCIHIITKESK